MAILKDRMTRSDPIWRRIIKRAYGEENKGIIKQTSVAGGSAGTIVVSAIKENDHLVSVIEVEATTAALADLTSEFSILADGAIANTTTDTTSNFLLVTWEAFDDE